MRWFIFYTIESCSIYINSSAMLIPGKSMPTIGVKIDGKYDDAIVIF